jgi:hypothetical protein
LGTLWAHQTEENPSCALGNDYDYKDTINQMINIPAECKPKNVRMISCSVLQLKIILRHLLNDDNPVVELLPLQDGVKVMQESLQMRRTIPEIFGSKKFSCGQLFVHFFPRKVIFRGKFRGISWKNDFSKLFPRKIPIFPNIFWGKNFRRNFP